MKCGVRAVPSQDARVLVFECRRRHEEEIDLGTQPAADKCRGITAARATILDREGEDPIVANARPAGRRVLLDLHQRQRPAGYDHAWKTGAIPEHCRIDRIAILRFRRGYETPVTRVRESERERTRNREHLQRAAVLELDRRAARRFDDDVEDVVAGEGRESLEIHAVIKARRARRESSGIVANWV